MVPTRAAGSPTVPTGRGSRCTLPDLRGTARRLLGPAAWLALSAITPLGVAGAVERIVTFDRIVVEGIDEDPLRQALLHAEPPDTPATETRDPPATRHAPPPSAAWGRRAIRPWLPGTSVPAPASSAGRPSTGAESPATPGAPGPHRPHVPPPGLLPAGPGGANPRFGEQGFEIEAFWAVQTGTPQGHFVRGHFHPRDLSTGFEGQHFGGPRELHGLFIRAADGRPFSVRGLSYRVTRNRELPGRSQSIDGFSSYNVNVLIATAFHPTLPVRGQFVAFGVGLPTGNDPELPFFPLPVTGFDDVTQVFIASSASVDFDDVVLEVE